MKSYVGVGLLLRDGMSTMVRTSEKSSIECGQRDAVRRELLRMIVKNEAQRRDQRKALVK